MTVADAARRAKHRGWLVGRQVRHTAIALRDRTYRAADRVRPPRWTPGAYGGTFLDTEVPEGQEPLRALPHRLFVLWTGDNELTPNRQAALEEIRAQQAGLDVVLVDPDSLASWVVPSHPLNSAYTNLSLVHRSDYLRAYLMHHHGGAYCDLKRGYGDVAACVRRLEASTGHWALGYREVSSQHAAFTPGLLGKALRRHHGLLIGGSAFVVRPHTALTTRWMSEVERRLDVFAPALEESPGGVWGDTDGYPVPWGDLLGAVFQPLCLKHHDRVLADSRMMPAFEGFR